MSFTVTTPSIRPVRSTELICDALTSLRPILTKLISGFHISGVGYGADFRVSDPKNEA